MVSSSEVVTRAGGASLCCYTPGTRVAEQISTKYFRCALQTITSGRIDRVADQSDGAVVMLVMFVMFAMFVMLVHARRYHFVDPVHAITLLAILGPEWIFAEVDTKSKIL